MTDTKVSKQIGVRVPNELHAELVKLAKAQRRSVGWIVRDLVEQGLAREAKRSTRRQSAAATK
jgi:predicted HicB family RNase H-like nuclease